jgi:hypothetical protein
MDDERRLLQALHSASITGRRRRWRRRGADSDASALGCRNVIIAPAELVRPSISFRVMQLQQTSVLQCAPIIRRDREQPRGARVVSDTYRDNRVTTNSNNDRTDGERGDNICNGRQWVCIGLSTHTISVFRRILNGQCYQITKLESTINSEQKIALYLHLQKQY